MFSIISFNNVRMSGMKSPVTSYAALGVGMAIVLSIGLTAIAGIVEQPVMLAEPDADVALAPPAERAERAAMDETTAEPGMPSEEIGVMKEHFAVEQPAGSFEGLSVAVPYVAAAIVGAAVFAVVRRRTF